MIQALSPNGTNDVLHVRVLPRRAISRQNFLNAKHPYPSGEYLSVNCIAVAEQIPRFFVHAAGLDQLLCSPGSGRMVGYIEMKDPTTVVAENDQTNKTWKLAVGTVRKSSEMSSLK